MKKLFKSRLFNNMSWLFIFNISNRIIPFFTFPYITRIFLPEGFGTIAFSLAFISYFQILIDYGFNLTGARKVATVENDQYELSKTYTTIFITKLLFFLLSTPLIIVIPLLNSKLYEYREIIFVFILLAFSNVLIPTWLFQGLQRVKELTIISLIVRIFFLISVFTFIKSKDDIFLYAFLYSLSFLLIGLISMIVVHYRIKITFSRITIIEILEVIKDGFYVFTSSAVISVMSSTGIFVLGLFYVTEYSGYYSAVTKIMQIITMFYYPIGQALFPYHSKKYATSFKDGYSSVVNTAKYIVPVFFAIAVFVILLRKHIVEIVLGTSFISASNLLIVLAFHPLLSIISNLMGTQILVASGYNREYSRAFIKGGLFSVLLYFVLGYLFAIWGVVFATVIGEIFSLLMLYKEVRRLKKMKGI